MNWKLLLWPLAMLVLTGCGGGGQPAGPGKAGAGGPAEGAARRLPPVPPPKAADTPRDPAKGTQEPPATPTGHEKTGDMVREPAIVGVGEKGRDLGAGLVATPITALFRTKERLAFLQVAQPMNLYKAEHGYFPKTPQEFEKEIIRKNSIQLPKLPEGSKYVYDPEKAVKMSTYDPDDPPLFVVSPQ